MIQLAREQVARASCAAAGTDCLMRRRMGHCHMCQRTPSVCRRQRDVSDRCVTMLLPATARTTCRGASSTMRRAQHTHVRHSTLRAVSAVRCDAVCTTYAAATSCQICHVNSAHEAHADTCMPVCIAGSGSGRCCNSCSWLVVPSTSSMRSSALARCCSPLSAVLCLCCCACCCC